MATSASVGLLHLNDLIPSATVALSRGSSNDVGQAVTALLPACLNEKLCPDLTVTFHSLPLSL